MNATATPTKPKLKHVRVDDRATLEIIEHEQDRDGLTNSADVLRALVRDGIRYREKSRQAVAST